MPKSTTPSCRNRPEPLPGLQSRLAIDLWFGRRLEDHGLGRATTTKAVQSPESLAQRQYRRTQSPSPSKSQSTPTSRHCVATTNTRWVLSRPRLQPWMPRGHELVAVKQTIASGDKNRFTALCKLCAVASAISTVLHQTAIDRAPAFRNARGLIFRLPRHEAGELSGRQTLGQQLDSCDRRHSIAARYPCERLAWLTWGSLSLWPPRATAAATVCKSGSLMWASSTTSATSMPASAA